MPQLTEPGQIAWEIRTDGTTIIRFVGTDRQTHSLLAQKNPKEGAGPSITPIKTEDRTPQP